MPISPIRFGLADHTVHLSDATQLNSSVTPSASTVGEVARVWYAGNKDSYWLCIKEANDTYGWTQLPF